MVEDMRRLRNLVLATVPSQFLPMCDDVLSDYKFARWPGGMKLHHQEQGGLLRHTWEVAQTAWTMTGQWEAVVAALFHDFGKTKEYVFVMAKGTWEKDRKFEKEVGHLVWGHHFFLDEAKACGMADEPKDAISHAILAHHGRREWGSPAEPRTVLAWAIHAADMLSMQEDAAR